jgi:chemotaxis protein methyltransferase CheR
MTVLSRPASTLDQRGFDGLCAFLNRRLGLAIGMDKRYLVETRILPIVARDGFASLADLVSSMELGSRTGLVDEVLQAMTVNETYFFRDRVPFERFRDDMLPALVAARHASKTLRVWSAASSTGQEAYSLAMVLADQSHHLRGWTIEILGTDFAAAAIKRAQEGVYTPFEVRRGLSEEHIAKYFDERGGQWHISPTIRSMVTFKRANLLDSFAAFGIFDVIFCRNVLIYMDGRVKADVVSRLRQSLASDGYLVLGTSESMTGTDAGLRMHTSRQYFQKY